MGQASQASGNSILRAPGTRPLLRWIRGPKVKRCQKSKLPSYWNCQREPCGQVAFSKKKGSFAEIDQFPTCEGSLYCDIFRIDWFPCKWSSGGFGGPTDICVFIWCGYSYGGAIHMVGAHGSTQIRQYFVHI